MRSILISVLLLILVMVLYEATIGGREGASVVLRERGSKLDQEIGGIDP